MSGTHQGEFFGIPATQEIVQAGRVHALGVDGANDLVNRFIDAGGCDFFTVGATFPGPTFTNLRLTVLASACPASRHTAKTNSANLRVALMNPP